MVCAESGQGKEVVLGASDVGVVAFESSHEFNIDLIFMTGCFCQLRMHVI